MLRAARVGTVGAGRRLTQVRIPVAVLGATGAVGQTFVRLLATHPLFTIAAVAGSERSVGKPYGEIVRWREATPLPPDVAALPVVPCEPRIPGAIAFSALDAVPARDIEAAFAAAGYAVVTNAKPHRLEADVPLLVPEINPHTLELLDAQRATRKWRGFVVANPNCSTAALVAALAPLHHAFGVERVFVTTLQAASGAGYPGVPSLDLLGNVIPFIADEEEKIEAETRKILEAPIAVSAHANRVPVVDGHTASVSVGFSRRVTVAETLEALRAFRAPDDVAALPSAPSPPLLVHDAPDRPQPRLDALHGGGMQVSVGRVRRCPILDVRLTLLGHNTVRGAAGAAIFNAELLVARGKVMRQ